MSPLRVVRAAEDNAAHASREAARTRSGGSARGSRGDGHPAGSDGRGWRAGVRGAAPTARASCRQVGRQGQLRGKCSTMRRTERSTHTASLSSRSRSVLTWASAQAVPGARRRRSWNRMYAASGQQHAELVGEEARATGPVHRQPVMQFLEPVLHVAPPAVELVDRLRGVGQIRDHEARIVLGVAPGMPHHLGLHDDPPLALPRPRGVPGLAEQVLGLRRWPSRRIARPAHQPAARACPGAHCWPSPRRTRRPRRSRKCKHLGAGKAAIQPDAQGRRGKGRPQLAEQPAQQPERAAAGRAVARPQHRGHQRTASARR